MIIMRSNAIILVPQGGQSLIVKERGGGGGGGAVATRIIKGSKNVRNDLIMITIKPSIMIIITRSISPLLPSVIVVSNAVVVARR